MPKPPKKPSDWTLLYIRGSDKKQLPVAQVHLRPDTTLQTLHTRVWPQVLQTMSKRARSWRVMLVEEHPSNPEPFELWKRPHDAAHFLRALLAWVQTCQKSDLNTDVALRFLHHHTLEDACACLLQSELHIQPKDLHTHELHLALERFVASGQHPQTLHGCQRRP